MKPDLPRVLFRGQLTTEGGLPLEGEIRLAPSVPAIDYLGEMFTTKAYTAKLDINGCFAFSVLPTDIGGATDDPEWKPWNYLMIGPNGVKFRVQLPSGGPHFLGDMLKRTKKSAT